MKTIASFVLLLILWTHPAAANQLTAVSVQALSMLAVNQLFPIVKGVDGVLSAPTLTELNNQVANQGGNRMGWLQGVNFRVLPLALQPAWYLEGDISWLYGFSQSPSISRTDEVGIVSPQFSIFYRSPLYKEEDYELEEFSYLYLDLGVQGGWNYIGYETRNQSGGGVVQDQVRTSTNTSWALVARLSPLNIPFMPSTFELKYRFSSFGDFKDEFGNNVANSATSFQGFQISVGQNFH